MIKPVIDSRHELVYCINCKHWDKLLERLNNNTLNKALLTPCCVCYSYNPKVGIERMIRKCYKKK